MKKLFIFFACCVYYIHAVAQENTLPVFFTDSLDNFIHKGMTDWSIPGLSIAVVKDGEVIYCKGFGVTRINGKEPVDENTLFMIGSNTKAFTSTALAILQESGAVNLNDKVQKWMPEFRLKDSLASRELTITDLLSHRIGFETFQGDFTYWASKLSRKQVIEKMALIDAPYGIRTKFGYCNAAFVTAGELIPRITGKSWEETVRNSILVPLKMERTLMLTREIPFAANVASPHTIIDHKVTEIPVANIDNLAPAGSMSSCAKDMSVWLLAQLNNGKMDNKQVIPDKAFRTVRTPATIIGLNQEDKKPTHFNLYCLGLTVNDRNGKLMYSHTGGVDGFLSSVIFVPEEKLGIVVMTNSDQNSFFTALSLEIADAFLGLPYQGNSYKDLKRFNGKRSILDASIDSLKTVVKQNHMPLLPLDAYTGKYTNPLYGAIEIIPEMGILKIRFLNHVDLTANLEYLDNGTFLCTYSNPTFGIAEIPFKTENGKVTGFTLRGSDFIEPTPYEFQKM